MEKQLFAAAVATLAGSANAEWIGPYAVSTVEISDSAIYFFKPSHLAGFPNPYGCANTDWVVFDGNTKLANRALSAGLAAQASNRKVKYHISGCLNGYVQASSVQVDASWQ